VTGPRRYELSSSSEVYASPRLSWNAHSLAMSSASSTGDVSGYNVSWNTVHATPASLAREAERVADGPMRMGRRKERQLDLHPYSVAIPESQCTFMEHLEVS
jgi:hypothetical protein